jgi:nucleoside-diphosphate-sugar epimerase
MRGYFAGKKKAENCLQQTYGPSGCALRPSMIYGTRTVRMTQNGTGISIPIWLIGRPLEWLFTGSFTGYLRERLPGMKAVLAPPISRDTVAKVAVAFAVGKIANKPNGIFTVEEMNEEVK